jgi:hypothetical protein
MSIFRKIVEYFTGKPEESLCGLGGTIPAIAGAGRNTRSATWPRTRRGPQKKMAANCVKGA